MDTKKPDRMTVSSGAPWEAQVGYSRAVRVGRHVMVAGTTAVGADGTLVGPGDAYAQARRCIEVVAAALEEAGAGLGDVVRTTMYVTDIELWPDVAKAHAEAFGEVRPAATMVEVSRLVDPAMLVELEVDAIVAGD